ncbi:DoxX family protein [Paenibacillus sp. P96]|uniref:DoxX family protein n=1 Tax=Paenibacillus zeirhizosphaerae TaxID=2987519 RepID=A0ABT9FN66_9BACL|nr:DoxX family protein [Paenibacillus sp. P96]MDP4096172.1 DoxX family protein [Paenibacillus sp. P96]
MNQTMTSLGLLLVRWMTGIIFIVHGAQKFQGLGGTTGFFQSLGLPGFLAPTVAAIELVGGILLVLGLGTRFAGAALTAVMIGVLLTAKFGQGFMAIEFDLIVLFGSLQQLLTGAGAYSVDAVIARKRSGVSNTQTV